MFNDLKKITVKKEDAQRKHSTVRSQRSQCRTTHKRKDC